MNSGRPRGLAALLTLALGAGTVAGAGLAGSPAWADDVLTGTYALNATSIWSGQTVKLSETKLDDPTPDTTVVRTVDWGDETSDVLGAEPLTHQYAANGTYQVSVSLQDSDPESAPVKVDVKPVQVAAATGTFKFNPTSAWTWDGGGATGKLTLASIPANATRVWVAWGDGETSLVKRTTTSVSHYYEAIGSYAATVTLENAVGKIAAKTAGSFAPRLDHWAPSATLKVPSSPSKASSWKTIQGTAKDNQIGMDAVKVQLFRWTSTKFWYYNFSTKKWVSFNPDKNPPSAAVSWRSVDSKGVWKLSVGGLTKGYSFEVMYTPFDLAGNYPAYKYRDQKLTS